MGLGHQHATNNTQERSLFTALILTSVFLCIEVAAGLVTGSLALLSDAGHMLTDVTALIISLVALKAGRRPTDLNRTFGYYRFEILAAVVNTILLFMVAIFIIYEAYLRLSHPTNIHSLGMMLVAGLGLMVNLISMRLLAHDKGSSLNIKSAYLEVWSDMIGSVGVILGGGIIYFTQWTWVDSLIAVLIGVWVIPRAISLLKESINILLEGVPREINLSHLKECMYKIEGVVDIHELHVWAISSNKISLTAHIVTNGVCDSENVLHNLRMMLASAFNICHITLQHERAKCLDDEINCHFDKHV